MSSIARRCTRLALHEIVHFCHGLLGDFAEFLRQLDTAGFEFVVIGGCAVIAYASLLGDELFSVDLGICVSQQTVVEILQWAPGRFV